MFDPFQAPWWLANPHLQTIWPTLHRRRLSIFTYRERWELDDGDFIDLDWLNQKTTPGQPIVLLLHGLEGSVASPYAQGMLAAIKKLPWQAVVMHFRGCSGEPNRLSRAYHSGEINDLTMLLKRLQQQHPKSPILAVGYSLGANVLVRYLGETDQSLIHAACAISPPLNLAACADRIGQGFSRVYQRHLLTRMKNNLLKKMATPALADEVTLCPQQVSLLNTFWQFDDMVTAPLHGFRDVHDYYKRMSGLQYLKSIHTPLLLIHAADDPFMNEAVIPDSNQLSPHVTYELTRRGGHVGFIEGGWPWRPRYWLERRVPLYFQQQLERK
ncbi:hydrolase [Corallincola platygyrae]|uniref:Hydrolase n=1 Tax=Corallincola platygyrae TaxID=1193278 RepID=A0ABW4XMZ9_9GAMM